MSLTQLAERLKHGADQAGKSLSEGWRELNARAGGANSAVAPAAL